ncbi:hypothetical protein F8O07_06560 [Pseudoclavibacter sp. CFCC 13796]|uniref:DUF7448 domain-containing protein n=1 Tax=unclassified Pseudoclavibacter TaxID=2615177 RepID=UPI0013010AB6|nr:MULTISPECIES: hypothetical protein [unclassified Pseudoclavibacter]KAB1661561.1 hypothetical protein F8O07_06560 [Pseudoclavibacter sp. CFCC 13796]MCD7100556.1 hypothetical protein [Pseudoclavibacter sp. 13-3]
MMIEPGSVWIRRRDRTPVVIVPDPVGDGPTSTTLRRIAWRALPAGRLNRTTVAAWEKKFVPLVRDGQRVSDAGSEIIRELLLGCRVTRVEEGRTLVLDSGIRLEVSGNIGCGGCSAGNYSITRLEAFDNAITRVEFPTQQRECDSDDLEYLHITVYAEGGTVPDRTILTAVGTPGNGYYGSGYTITVRLPE